MVAAALGEGPPVAAAVAVATPVLVDLACAVTGPFERLAVGTYVRRARERLREVAPTVVAITGSYGKTGTKGYVAHLVAGTKTVVASPASFNNRAGLARAVNENLVDGTEVFVAEMGTYGPGEIAELCSWLRPRRGRDHRHRARPPGAVRIGGRASSRPRPRSSGRPGRRGERRRPPPGRPGGGP